MPPSDTVVGALIQQAFQASGLELPRAIVVTGAIQMLSALIGLGPYLAIFPSSMLEFSPQRRAFQALNVDLPIPPSPVTITTFKNRTISPVAQIFIECARQLAKPLQAWSGASPCRAAVKTGSGCCAVVVTGLNCHGMSLLGHQLPRGPARGAAALLPITDTKAIDWRGRERATFCRTHPQQKQQAISPSTGVRPVTDLPSAA